MTELRRRMDEDMLARGFADWTREAYLWAVAGLARFYRRSPDRISDAEVQAYLVHLLRDRQLSGSTCNIVVSGLRFFFHTTLKRDRLAANKHVKLSLAMFSVRKPGPFARMFTMKAPTSVADGSGAPALYFTAGRASYLGGHLARSLPTPELERLARFGAQARLESLEQERAAILRFFPDLDGSKAPVRTEHSATPRRRPRQRRMSAAERRTVSERMTKYWADRRAGKEGRTETARPARKAAAGAPRGKRAARAGKRTKKAG